MNDGIWANPGKRYVKCIVLKEYTKKEAVKQI